MSELDPFRTTKAERYFLKLVNQRPEGTSSMWVEHETMRLLCQGMAAWMADRDGTSADISAQRQAFTLWALVWAERSQESIPTCWRQYMEAAQ